MTPLLRTVTSGLSCSSSGLGHGVSGIIEPIEISHLVGTVRGAIARADAAVVDLGIQAIRRMVGGAHRADDLAGRRLALLAHHRQELGALLGKLLGELRALAPVALDPKPVHRLALREALLAHYGQIVLRIAGGGARIAAGAGVEVDDHGPLVGSLLVLIRLGALGPQLRPVIKSGYLMTKGVSLLRSTWSAASVATSFRPCCRVVGPSSLMIRSCLTGLGDRRPASRTARARRSLVEDRIEDL